MTSQPGSDVPVDLEVVLLGTSEPAQPGAPALKVPPGPARHEGRLTSAEMRDRPVRATCRNGLSYEAATGRPG